jgi:flavin reductase (DIM6/NTAB) family NADH-FMN oxidoreductase RutF
MKQFVKPFEYAEEICNALSKGVLLTTRHGDEVNTMTIGWGMLGIEWGKPVFLALVRQSRHTKKLLDATGEFTVNIPLEAIDKKILGYCGSKSGREVDKIKDLGLILEDPEVISVPGIRQLPLTLECKVLYQQTQDASKFPQSIVDRYYPQPYDDHTVYYGEIVSAYVIKE